MVRHWKKVLGTVVAIPMVLLGVFFAVAEIGYKRSSLKTKCEDMHSPIQGDEIVQRFSEALKIKTITKGRQDYDRDALLQFHEFLRKSFPLIHSSAPNVVVETVNNYSILIEVKGRDEKIKPYLLCSHMDVVPVELDKWDVDPWSGVIKDGFIYGRGTIDVKNTLMAIMESLEYLLARNQTFNRGFFIAFGHDEEALGVDGAQFLADRIEEKLKARNIEGIDFLLDEGTMLFQNAFPGVTDLVALVAVAEKGYATMKMTATGQVGHSSIPARKTSINTLAEGISRFHSHTYPNMWGKGPEGDMISVFARLASYPYKLIFANLWFFSPIMGRFMAEDPSGNALIRTTSAVTIINGGYKENVVPDESHAIINHRIHPSMKVADVLKFDQDLVKDLDVKIEMLGSPIEPHPVSPYGDDAHGYQIVSKSIMQVFNVSAVIPGIMIANTDTRWYLKLTENVYRFSPSVMATKDDTKRFHGHNERISVENYMQTVNFYHHMMINSNEWNGRQTRMLHDEL